MTNRVERIELTEAELRLLHRAAKESGAEIDAERRHYTAKELSSLGIVREGYLESEVDEKGLLVDGVVTSHDEVSKRAEHELAVEAPFGSGIVKWQLPVNLSGVRLLTTRFPPDTVVKPHVHPKFEGHAGGGFRLVLQGSITYAGKRFGPGDWFYIPNDTPYSFTTDKDVETHEAYIYEYTPRSMDGRFSRPLSVAEHRAQR